MFVESLSKIMPTFRAIVRQHHVRKDGKYPVSIRVTQNRESVYIPTGLYVSKKQVSKYFELKDQFVIERTNQTIRQYEQKLLAFDTEELRITPAKALASILMRSNKKVSYSAYCEKMIAENPIKRRSLKGALVLAAEIGYTDILLSDVDTTFVQRFRKYIDEKEIPVREKRESYLSKYKKKEKKGEYKMKGYSAAAKNAFMNQLHLVYKQLVLELGNEASNYTKIDPFAGLPIFKRDVPKKGSIPVEDLRKFFAYQPTTEHRQLVQDMVRMSFCMGGMNIGDLLTVTKDCYDGERLTYERHKIKGKRADRGRTSIKIQTEIADLVEKYKAKSGELLFDFGGLEFKDGTSRNFGMMVYALCELAEIPRYNFYLFRHTVATIARNKFRYSRDDVGMLLNHRGAMTVDDVYIDDDWSINDEINRKILDYVFHGKE